MYESFRILKTGAQKIKTETVRILILLIEEIIIVSKKKKNNLYIQYKQIYATDRPYCFFAHAVGVLVGE